MHIYSDYFIFQELWAQTVIRIPPNHEHVLMNFECTYSVQSDCPERTSRTYRIESKRALGGAGGTTPCLGVRNCTVSWEPIYQHMCLSKVTPMRYKGEQGGKRWKKSPQSTKASRRTARRKCCEAPNVIFLVSSGVTEFPQDSSWLTAIVLEQCWFCSGWVGGNAFYNLQIRTKPLSGLTSWSKWPSTKCFFDFAGP